VHVKIRTRWNDFLSLITDDRDFRPQTCTNGLVFRECKHIKNSFEDVYFNVWGRKSRSSVIKDRKSFHLVRILSRQWRLINFRMHRSDDCRSWNFITNVNMYRDFRPQTCTNDLVLRECKHIKNIFEEVYFTKNSFNITLKYISVEMLWLLHLLHMHSLFCNLYFFIFKY
jgi:hypothetical protein